MHPYKVPGFPFKVACEQMVKVGTPLGALKAAADVYYNYTGQVRKDAQLCTKSKALSLSNGDAYSSNLC